MQGLRSARSRQRALELTAVQGWLFSDDDAAFVEREQPAWKEWLESLAIPAA